MLKTTLLITHIHCAHSENKILEKENKEKNQKKNKEKNKEKGKERERKRNFCLLKININSRINIVFLQIFHIFIIWRNSK